MIQYVYDLDEGHRAGGGSTATASDEAKLGLWYVRQPMCIFGLRRHLIAFINFIQDVRRIFVKGINNNT